MRVERQPAYILHERHYRETSVLLEVLTRDHGRVGLVARGVRTQRPRLPRGTLKPLQALELSWQGRGEMGTLTAADPVGTPIPLTGDGALCALYLNELLTRLLARNDPHAAVFSRYAGTLFELASANLEGQAWALRRFERDLLAELGYALQVGVDADDLVLEPQALYVVDPERGVQRVGSGLAVDAIHGAALLALSADAQPMPEHARQLRRMMRSLLRHHLGGRELSAWSIRFPSAAIAGDRQG